MDNTFVLHKMILKQISMIFNMYCDTLSKWQCINFYSLCVVFFWRSDALLEYIVKNNGLYSDITSKNQYFLHLSSEGLL